MLKYNNFDIKPFTTMHVFHGIIVNVVSENIQVSKFRIWANNTFPLDFESQLHTAWMFYRICPIHKVGAVIYVLCFYIIDPLLPNHTLTCFLPTNIRKHVLIKHRSSSIFRIRLHISQNYEQWCSLKLFFLTVFSIQQ